MFYDILFDLNTTKLCFDITRVEFYERSLRLRWNLQLVSIVNIGNQIVFFIILILWIFIGK